MSRTTDILDPRGKKAEDVVKRTEGPLLPKLTAVSGKTLAIVNNGWTAMDSIANLVAEGLKTRYGISKILYYPVPLASAAAQATIDAVVKEADFAVVGLAN